MLESLKSNSVKRNSLVNSLSTIYGINKSRALYILSLLGLSLKLTNKMLNKYLVEIIKNIIFQLYLIAKELEFIKKKQKNLYMDIRHYKGRRYKVGLPVRGQRTKTNAKTSRKFIILKNKDV